MDIGTFKLIELFLFFGAFFGFCLWQLYSVNKEIAEHKALKARESQPGESSE